MTDAREVRDLLARTAYDAEWEGSIDDVGEIERAMAYQIADAQLAALSEAGLTVCGERMEADLEAAKAALSAVDHATYGWSFATAVAVIDKIRLIARSQERIQSEEPK